ncbi:DUF418 domain-containing protein [Sphingomonas sp. RS6]
MTHPPSQRLLSLDIVRGTAVLGILLLNIVGFAMPEPAYFNPRAFGGWHGADLAVYLVNFILFDGRMRGLFSFLFGASLLIVCDSAEANDQSAPQVHFMRMAWLLAFGLAHLWLVWDGDILAHYALVGMIAFAFRRLRTEQLVGLGCVLVLIASYQFAVVAHSAWMLGHHPDPAHPRALAQLTTGFGTPPPDWIATDIALHRGDYLSLLRHRIDTLATAPLRMLLLYGWETLAYMLFGMAALRSGLLSGAWPAARYRSLWLICWAISIPGFALIAAYMVAAQFDMPAVAIGAFALAAPLRPPAILGWACLILLLARRGGWLSERLAAAGRMAFTNYLATSVLCVLLFEGFGLGWYGSLSRWQLYPVVFIVWALILLWSLPWLRHFRYGPMEWLWRSLARGRVQLIRNTLANRSQ